MKGDLTVSWYTAAYVYLLNYLFYTVVHTFVDSLHCENAVHINRYTVIFRLNKASIHQTIIQ